MGLGGLRRVGSGRVGSRTACRRVVRLAYERSCQPGRTCRGLARKRCEQHDPPESGVPTTFLAADEEGFAMAVMIGVDPHKGSHTAVVIDGDEVEIGDDPGAVVVPSAR